MDGWVLTKAEAAEFVDMPLAQFKRLCRDGYGPKSTADGGYYVDDLVGWQEVNEDWGEVCARLPHEHGAPPSHDASSLEDDYSEESDPDSCCPDEY